MDIKSLEKELHRLEEYSWQGQRQNDSLDKLTNFVYDISRFESVQEKIQELKKENKNFPENYAFARWYNFWCSKGLEAIFNKSERVEKEEYEKHKFKDFTIKGIAFDLKLTVIPDSLKKRLPFPRPNLIYLNEKPDILLSHFYTRQSRKGRFHTANRLFVVCYDLNEPEKSWELKRELRTITPLINLYNSVFDEKNIPILQYKKAKIKSDIIFFVKEDDSYFGLLTQKHTNGYRKLPLKHRL